MLEKHDYAELIIKNTQINNMSNWQISHMINTMTTINNKFDIIDKIQELISHGAEKKDIFIFDKSFLFSTGYRTYFENGNELKNSENGIIKIATMGKFIPMEYNEDLIKINSLFAFYKMLNSFLYSHLSCRLERKYLYNSYNKIFIDGMENSYQILLDGLNQQVEYIYHKNPHMDFDSRDKINKILLRLNSDKKKQLDRNYTKYQKSGIDCSKNFTYCFNRLDRPIVGLYDSKDHSFKIINADQMFKNGEEYSNQLKLKTITKNSPVLIALGITGIMLFAILYLIHRSNQVNNTGVNESTISEKSKSTVLSQETSSETPDIVQKIYSQNSIDIESPKDISNERILDSQLHLLANDNLRKLDCLTNNKKVSLELKADINIKL